MTGAPKEIWLQMDQETADVDGSTWCQDKINDTDVRYVRADAAPLRVLNALEVLGRMDYRPGDRALVENFLRIMGERGMWVIESPLAAAPSLPPLPSDPEWLDKVARSHPALLVRQLASELKAARGVSAPAHHTKPPAGTAGKETQ